MNPMNRLKLPDLDHLSYDPNTGTITENEQHVGHINHYGYHVINVGGTAYYAHRIAWKIYYKEEPPEHLDHINRDKGDNRIKNLRKCTDSENKRNRGVQKNSKTTLKGIVFDHERGQYRVTLRKNNKQHHWGRYYNALDAIEARLDAEEYHWGVACRK